MSLIALLSSPAAAGASDLESLAPFKVDRLLPLEEGLHHLREKRYEQAIESLSDALKREPGRFAAVRGLVTAYLLDGNPAHAKAAMNKFLADHPMAGDGWQLAAQLAWKLGDFSGAISLLHSGLDRLPHSPKLRRQLSIFRAACNEFEDTIAPPTPSAEKSSAAMDADWLDQIAADPVLLSAVLAFLKTDSSPLSIESRPMLEKIERKLSILLAAQPNHADRQLLLATLQTRLDQLPAAMLSVNCALQCNPNLATAERLRATLFARLGDTDQALSILRGLVQRGYSWPDIHYEIAEIEQQSGRASEARAHLYSAICLNPKFTEARQFLERIAA
jgi:tetratricopeptide (TPR) repeat protein